MRANQRERLATESAEERAARLQQVSANQRERLATESAEERAARLQQVRANQRERLATESAEERAARLQQVSANQRERLATESAEEREARLLHVRTNQRERRAAESSSLTCATIEEPFKQRSVQLKMRKFHEHFASLSSPKCSTCFECFPGLQLCPSGTECMRCYRDKRTPKLYSAINKMNPGPQPPQLEVSIYVSVYHACELCLI